MFSGVFLGKVATTAPIDFKKMKCSLDIAFCTIHFVKIFRDFFGTCCSDILYFAVSSK